MSKWFICFGVMVCLIMQVGFARLPVLVPDNFIVSSQQFSQLKRQYTQLTKIDQRLSSASSSQKKSLQNKDASR